MSGERASWGSNRGMSASASSFEGAESQGSPGQLGVW